MRSRAGRLGLCVGLLVWTAACTAPVHFRMTSPQASAENRYIGPDLEVLFDFTPRTIIVQVLNSGDTDVVVDWDQATFVGGDGAAVRLEAVGTAPSRTLPLGSITRVELTLTRWSYPEPTLWQRRSWLEQRIVHPELLKRCAPVVRIVLPVQRHSETGSSRENLEFTFYARAVDDEAGPAGGRHVPVPEY